MSAARALRAVRVDEPLIPLEAVAEYLGVAVQTLYAWRKHGRGPRGYRVGGRVQFRLSEVNAWLEQQREPLR